jgi:phosphatidylserine/phosphatidylglycerophosphate/cardiolipin synthase-like enzyme
MVSEMYVRAGGVATEKGQGVRTEHAFGSWLTAAATSRRGGRRRFRPALVVAALGLLVVAAVGCGTLCLRRLPTGVYMQGTIQPAFEPRFLSDLTFVDATGVRQSEQHIFDEALRLIAEAQTLVVADMFLYNEWLGTEGRAQRPLTREFTQALLEKKQRCPHCAVVLITDPINTAYGGARAPHLERLRAAGVVVVETDLDRLRDSNPLYSMWWRLLARPFGNAPASTLPNPFGAGRVSIRTYLRLLNFKANHRKVIVADPAGELTGLVTSANPHDGSSAHSNVAIRFSGSAVLDLLGAELAVAEFSGTALDLAVPAGAVQACTAATTVQVVTERAIEQAILTALADAGPGDEVDLAIFYLSDRSVTKALIAAQRRGARLRVVLDPNKDAFGRQKNGIPNRPVARVLHNAGIPVRWYDTHGEQFHAKMLLVRYAGGQGVLIAGSANCTRRNLDNLNLETDVAVRGPTTAPVLQDARDFVDTVWENRGGRLCTTDYLQYCDSSVLRYWKCMFMELTGVSTF